MATYIPKRIGGDGHAQGIQPWVPFALLAAGIPWAVFSLLTLLGGGNSQMVALEVEAGWFVILGIGYLGMHGLRNLAFFSIPALLTIRALFEFIAVPAWRFATGQDEPDSSYVYAMLLSLLGFAAFWVGSLIFMRGNRLQFVSQMQNRYERVVFTTGVTLGVGIFCNFILWKSGLLSYTGDKASVEAHIAAAQWVTSLARMVDVALLISSIQVFGGKFTGPVLKGMFGLALISAIGFGAVSGMKENILRPVVVLVFIYGITRKRIPATAFVVLPLLLLFTYPFVNAYRANLNHGYRSQVDTIGGLTITVRKSVQDVISDPLSVNAKRQSSFDQATSRLSLLSLVRDIVALPAPSLLNGDEKVWLAPFYPFVPRFIWKSKPVLDKGSRLSVALGRPDTTASAVTPIGDLFTLYGSYGVLIGMFVYGICVQIYMNWFGRRIISERGLLVYVSMVIPLTNLEPDVTGLVAGAIQSLVLMIIVSYAVYGSSSPTSRQQLA